MNEIIRFAIIGSGWRAKYYIRIAQKIPERFEVAAVVCRRPEKAEHIMHEFGVPAVLSPQECMDRNPDFVVVAVDKPHIAEVAAEWLGYGFAVLAETPAAMDRETLEELKELERHHAKLVFAEQYRFVPENAAVLKLLDAGLIGTPHSLYLSLAHEYHAVSLMRAFLQRSIRSSFTVRAKEWVFPTAETLSRYERFTDGRMADKKRMAALFEFADGTFCLYDFDSEQYRSPIRGSHMRLTGSRGEICGNTVRWLDENNTPHCEILKTETRIVKTNDPNPNFESIEEAVSVSLGQKILYEPEYGLCGLSRDDAAIAHMLGMMNDYARGRGNPPYPLRDAIADAYAAILLREAAAEGVLKEADMLSYFDY